MGGHKTPITNTGSYLPVSEFLNRCDVSLAGDLCSDGPDRVPVGSLATDPKLAAALLDACGDLESAVFVSNRYSVADLLAIPSGTPAEGKLYSILTDLTMRALFRRKPEIVDEFKVVERAEKALNDLKEGKIIFSFAESAEAGLLEPQHVSPEDVTRERTVSVIMEDYFGRRANRWPRNC